MTGAFSLFFLLSLIQITVVGGTTSATIYSRLMARNSTCSRRSAGHRRLYAPAVAAAIIDFPCPVLSTYTAGDTATWFWDFMRLPRVSSRYC